MLGIERTNGYFGTSLWLWIGGLAGGCLTALMLQNRGKSVTDFQTRVAKKSGGRVGSSV